MRRSNRSDLTSGNQAQLIYAALLATVTQEFVPHLYDTGSGQVIINIDRDIYKSDATRRLRFAFEGAYRTYYTDANQMIHVGIGPFHVKNYMHVIATAVQRHKRSLIHEIIHHLDYLRMRQGWEAASKTYKTDTQDIVEYYNHPLEMNAYFQAYASAVIENWHKIIGALEDDTGPDKQGSGDHQTAVWQMSDIAETSFGMFLHEWQQADSSRFWNNLTPANQRRMRTRVYALYDQIVLEARRRLVELKKCGDPMALMF